MQQLNCREGNFLTCPTTPACTVCVHFITAPVYAKCSLLFRIIVCAIHSHTHTFTHILIFTFTFDAASGWVWDWRQSRFFLVFRKYFFFFSHNLSDAVTTAAALVAPVPFAAPLPLALVLSLAGNSYKVFALHSFICGRHRSIQVITKYCDLSLSRLVALNFFKFNVMPYICSYICILYMLVLSY